MIETKVDYTIFFRELSNIPNEISQLEKSFYGDLKMKISYQDGTIGLKFGNHFKYK